MSSWLRHGVRLGLVWPLLALVLLLAGGAAALAWVEGRAVYNGPSPLKPPPRGNGREQPAIDAVAALGAQVMVDAGAPDRPVVGVNMCFPRNPINDADLRRLQTFTGLRELHVCMLHPDDAGLHTLGGLTSLRTLDVGGTPVTDDGLECLTPLADLERLDLSDSQVTDAGLKRLSAFPHLSSLALEGTQIGDDGMEAVCGLANLQSLLLDRTRVTDAGLASLVDRLAGLRELDLSHTRVTAAALLRLAALPGLERLGLAGLPITDDDLTHLADFPNLRQVLATHTHVTSRGVEELHKTRPAIAVLTDDTVRRR